MIEVYLTGGLGNQMFQYAAAYSLSKKFEIPVKLNLNWFEAVKSQKNVAKRYLDLAYASPTAVFHTNNRFTARIKSMKGLAGERIAAKLRGFEIFRESDAFRYDPKVEGIRRRSLLIGMFQSQNYFKNNRLELLSQFRRFVNDDQYLRDIRDKTSEEGAVAVHIRRGDYVTNSDANKVHGVQSIEYYKRALNRLQESASGLSFYVFSDDLSWTSQQDIWPSRTTFVEDRHYHPSIGMNLIANCQHQIISNSTYSWWGAWLKDRKGQIIMPKMWLRDRPTSDTDLVLDSSITLS